MSTAALRGGTRGAPPRSWAFRVTPLTRRRFANFRANRRGFWSLWIFLALFGASLFAEFIANDRPLLVVYQGSLYFPVLTDYPETTFGGDLPIAADYRDTVVRGHIDGQGLDGVAAHPVLLHTPSTTICPRPRRRRPPRSTGSAPTTRAATCWRGSSTASASRSCSGWR